MTDNEREWKKKEIEDRWKTSEIFGGVTLGIIIETFAILFFKFLLWMLGGFI